MTNNASHSDFITRTLKTSVYATLFLIPFVFYYFGLSPLLSALSGVVWSLLNLYFLSAFVKAFLRPDGPDKNRSIRWAIIKFPLLYVAAYFLLQVSAFDVRYILAGFTFPFCIMLLKGLGRVMLNLDDKKSQSHKPTGVRS